MTTDTDTASRRSVLAAATTVVLVVSTVAAGVSLTAVGTASAAPTPIDDCTTIGEPGVYELTGDLTQPSGDPCIRIVVSHVTLDGDGYEIESTGSRSETRLVANGSRELTNVTVRDLTLSSYRSRLLFENVSDGRLEDVEVGATAGLFGTARITGDDNTLTGSMGSAVVSVDGDGTRVVDLDTYGGLGVSGVGATVHNASVPSLSVSGTDLRVVDNSIDRWNVRPDRGLLARNVTDAAFVNNTVVAGTAMRLEDGVNVSVRDSVLASPDRAGLDVTGSSDVRVVNSTLASAYEGLVVTRSSGVRVVNSDLVSDFDAYDGLNVTKSADIGIVNSTVTGGATFRNSDDSTIRGSRIEGSTPYGNSFDGVAVTLVGSANNTFRSNSVAGDHGFALDGRSGSNLIYDNVIATNESPLAPANGTLAPNEWNVSARPGENAVGGDTVGGNYYAEPDGTGFSRTCDDADDDGFCDAPNELAANNTDSLPLAGPANDTDDRGDGPGATHYQVDFVAGPPIENLSADRLYARQDRLFRFAFGNTDEGLTEKGSAWASEDLRECVDYGHVEEHADGTASVSFTVVDDCENVTLSLAVHSLPGETFDVDTADRQELLHATTGTYAPGEHVIAVELPDGDEDAESARPRSPPFSAPERHSSVGGARVAAISSSNDSASLVSNPILL